MNNTNDIRLIKSNQNEKDFKKIIIEGSKLISEKNGSLSTESTKIETYFDMAWDSICRLTNIKKVLKKELLSPNEIRGEFFRWFYSFRDYNDNDLIEKFIDCINEKLSELKNLNPKIANFAFYTNLKVSKKNMEQWKDLLKDFNIERLTYDDLEIPVTHTSEQSTENFKSRNEILNVKIKSRSIFHAFDESKRELYKLFGFLAFGINYNLASTRFHINEFALNHSSTSIKIVSYIILDENNILSEDYDSADIRLETKIGTNTEKLKFPPKLNRFHEKYKDIMNSDKSKLKFKLNEMFELYFHASSESALDSSFLKFWSFSERFLKDMFGDMKDKKLLNMMNNLLEGYGISRQNKIKLEFLYKKRNLLVHEIKSDTIEENDRNFVKIIADKLLLFSLYHFKDVNNINEYGYIIENYSISSSERKRNIELLELLEQLDSNKGNNNENRKNS